MAHFLLYVDDKENGMEKRLTRFVEIVVLFFVLMLLAVLINRYYFLPKTINHRQNTKVKQQQQLFSELKFIPKPVNNLNESEAKSIPVLLYHGIKESPVLKGDILTDNFQQQMVALKMAGYQTIKIDDFYDYIQGRKKIPEKSFLLTFDDGRKDSYYSSDHILRDLNFSAVMFVITGHSLANIKSSYYLNETELRAMQNSGRWDLQSHGKYDHDLITINPQGEKGWFMSNRMWLVDQKRYESDEEFKDRIHNDLIGGRDDIQRVIGAKPIAFAFPAGDYGTRNNSFPGISDIIVNEVKSIFPIAFYQFSTISAEGYYRNDSPNSDNASLLKRIKVNNDIDAVGLINTLNAALAKRLPYRADFSNDKDWILISGQKTLTNNSLTIHGEAADKSTIVYIDGTQGWTNYRLDAQIDSVIGDNFSIVSRSTDGSNYLSCNYSKNSLRLDQTINDHVTVLAQNNRRHSLFSSSSVGMIVSGNSAACLVNGSVAVTTNHVSQKLNHGGIGFKIWNSLKSVMNLRVGNLNVQEAN